MQHWQINTYRYRYTWQCTSWAVLWVVLAVTRVNAQPPLTALTFAPDTPSLIAGSQTGLQILKWPSLESQQTLVPSFANVNDLAFSPDERRLAVAGGDPANSGSVELLAWPELKSLRVLAGHDDSVMAVQWLNDNELASASLDQRITIWNVTTGQPLRVLQGHSRGITSLAFVPAANMLVSGGFDHSLRVWQLDTGQLRHSLTLHTLPIHALATRPAQDGLPMVASCSEDRTVRFWQPTIGRLVRFIRLPAKPLCLCWQSDGSRIAAGCDDGAVYWIDPETVRIVERYEAPNRGWIYSLATSPIHDLLIAGGSSGVFTIDNSAILNRSLPCF